jgi:hypothetical protein
MAVSHGCQGLLRQTSRRFGCRFTTAADVLGMENDDQQVTVCAACDLAARLRVELKAARNHLLAHGSELAKWRPGDEDGCQPMVDDLRRAIREDELHVAALDAIVADLCCDCETGDRPAHPECTDAAA